MGEHCVLSNTFKWEAYVIQQCISARGSFNEEYKTNIQPVVHFIEMVCTRCESQLGVLSNRIRGESCDLTSIDSCFFVMQSIKYVTT